MQLPSSSSSAGTTQSGFILRNVSPNCSPAPRSICTVSISSPFSARKIRTRRGLGAVWQSKNFILPSLARCCFAHGFCILVKHHSSRLFIPCLIPPPTLAQIDTTLYRRALLQRIKPAPQVWEIIEIVAKAPIRKHPRKARDIRDRVVASKKVTVTQAHVHDRQQPVVFVRITFVRIRHILLHVIYEMAELSCHRTESTRLPEQPLEYFESLCCIGRQKPAGLLSEIDKNRPTFEHGNTGLRINDCRNSIIRADGQEFGGKLIARAYVDRPDLILQSTLLEHNGYLVTVWCWPVIEFDHDAYQLYVTLALTCRPAAGVPGNVWNSLSVRLSATSMALNPLASAPFQTCETYDRNVVSSPGRNGSSSCLRYSVSRRSSKSFIKRYRNARV